MFSALAVGMNGVPGEGFFSLAQQLGRLTDNSKEAASCPRSSSSCW